jgi:DDE superfamily endonuclease
MVEEEDEEELEALIDTQQQPPNTRQRRRKAKTQFDCGGWDAHVASLTDARFDSRYRMSKTTFDRLLALIAPKLEVDETKSRNSTGGLPPIIPAHCLHCLLRYLAGGSYLDISDIVHMSESSFTRVIWKTLDAVNACPELAMDLPFPPDSNPDRIDELKATFRRAATCPAFHNCVGAIDGWLAVIRTPTKAQEPNVRSFFSGHYKTMGLNVQAMVDGNCAFTYVAINSPGGTNDLPAYRKSRLPNDFTDNLEVGTYIVADNAYPLGSHLLVPFRPTLTDNENENQNENYCFCFRNRKTCPCHATKTKTKMTIL